MIAMELKANMLLKNELQKQLNQLHNNCIVYREVLISVAKIENILFEEDRFMIEVKPEYFLLNSRFKSNRKDRISRRLMNGWKFGCVWEILRYENGWFYGYGSWGFCCEPKFVSKIKTLVEQERIGEAMNLIP